MVVTLGASSWALLSILQASCCFITFCFSVVSGKYRVKYRPRPYWLNPSSPSSLLLSPFSLLSSLFSVLETSAIGVCWPTHAINMAGNNREGRYPLDSCKLLGATRTYCIFNYAAVWSGGTVAIVRLSYLPVLCPDAVSGISNAIDSFPSY